MFSEVLQIIPLSKNGVKRQVFDIDVFQCLEGIAPASLAHRAHATQRHLPLISNSEFPLNAAKSSLCALSAHFHNERVPISPRSPASESAP